MKAILADYQKDPLKIEIQKNAEPESWPEVCQRFDDDVSRVCDVDDLDPYTGLYECFDEKNLPHFYLVQEDSTLFRMKHKRFLENIGLKK